MFIHFDELQLQAKFFREGFNCWVNTEDDLCFALPDRVATFPKFIDEGMGAYQTTIRIP